MGRLVLERKQGESFVLYGENGAVLGAVVVTKIADGRAKVVIEAPECVKILRGELVGKAA